MSIPPRRIAYERYHGGTPITYRPAENAYSGVNKVADLASRSIFPGVFYAAEKLIRTEGYVPDVKLYGALIEACANFPGCLLQPLAFKLLDEMKERGLTPGPAIYCNLLRVGFLRGGPFGGVGGESIGVLTWEGIASGQFARLP